MFFTFVRVVIIWLAMVSLSWAAPPERRVALVLGNGNYENLQQLKNPNSDAQAIAHTLAALEFTVFLATDLNRNKIQRAIDFFEEKAQDADVALIYFAGHGARINGENYLLPTDFDITNIHDLSSTISVDDIQEQLGEGVRTNIIIVDACQDDPLLKFGEQNSDLFIGSIQPDVPPIGSLVAFASAAGRAAYDGAGSHSLFTGALLDRILTAGADVELVLRDVRRDVVVNSDGKQIPQTASSLVSGFQFLPHNLRDITPLVPNVNLSDDTVPTNTQLVQSLSNNGFSSKPILDQIALGLPRLSTPESPVEQREKLRIFLCCSLSHPLPKQCAGTAKNNF